MQTFSTAVNTVAKAKVIYYKDKETYKIVFAFIVHKKVNDNVDSVHILTTEAKCAYVSGDIDPTEVLQTLHNASKVIRSTNIELVE